MPFEVPPLLLDPKKNQLDTEQRLENFVKIHDYGVEPGSPLLSIIGNVTDFLNETYTFSLFDLRGMNLGEYLNRVSMAAHTNEKEEKFRGLLGLTNSKFSEDLYLADGVHSLWNR